MRYGKVRHLHFVGVGGVGMCGLAEILLGEGLEVSGCDLADSERTDRLRRLGARVGHGHDPQHLEGVDVVVVSAAVNGSNPEVVAALERGLPVVRRAEMLAELMRLRSGVAVAGTHGKTTTTSLTGHVLTEAGLDPTVIVGGRVHLLGAHARLGGGQVLVCEADEYDRSFLELAPVWAVITNIEAEHMDCYDGPSDLEDAFATFAGRVPFHGAVIACVDDPGVQRLLPRLRRRVLTYGSSPQAWLRGVNPHMSADGTRFEVVADDQVLGQVHLPLPGQHNVSNALATIAVGLELELPFEDLQAGLGSFTGVARRFETRGERDGVIVVDDYAHHPTELRAAVAAARQAFPGRRLVAVFQPHLYSRTRDFAAAFADALMAAEVAVLLPIYPAREEPIAGVTSELVAEEARRLGHRQVVEAASLEAGVDLVSELVRPGDVLLTMGAGDVHRVGEDWLGGAP
jgi:UDP-N-acetylmuramate--alanine ligase